MSNNTSRTPRSIRDPLLGNERAENTSTSGKEVSFAPTTTTTKSNSSNGKSELGDDALLNENLKGLKNLTHEEKTQLGMYKARVEEQSRLIMAIKQRCDEFICKNLALERTNKELMEKSDESERKAYEATSKYKVLDSRFQTLASNHDELIQIKDEYKQKCTVLEQRVRSLQSQLSDDTSRGELEKERTQLGKKLEMLRALVADYELRCADLIEKHEYNVLKMEERFSESETKLKEEISFLNRHLDESRHQIDELKAKVAETSVELNMNRDADSAKIEALSRDKLELSGLCEKLKQEKYLLNSECNELRHRLEDLRKDLMEKDTNQLVAELKYQVELSTIKYRELEKEFASYKVYSHGLLQREREMNMKLQEILN